MHNNNNLLIKVRYLLIFLFPTFLHAQIADLELIMTSNNPQVGIYDYVTVTTTIANTGTQSADDVIVNFDIPTGVAIAGEFPPDAEQGSLEGFFGGSSQGNWFVGDVVAGQSLTFDITFFTLSESNTSFYGQVFQGGDNDPDSTPGNGTCCTANEDDEVAYTFPNDEPGCTFDQAFAELICNDNETPNDVSDDSYTLRFRADGSNGEFTLFIPELNYNQTSEYSIGFTELAQLSLDIENLTLIFSDEAGTEECGETAIVTAPACGDTPQECNISRQLLSNVCNDQGTEDPSDDTFTTSLMITNGNSTGGFVSGVPFGCGAIGSGNYGEIYTFTQLVATYPFNSNVCHIVDSENPDCMSSYFYVPPSGCGQIQFDCEIIYNEISNTIDDMGTPDNLFDDTFTIVYTIENAGGGTGFVGQFGGQFCGSVPSTGNYGEVYTFTENIANWGNGSPVGCEIVDNENPDCTGGYTLLPDVTCGFGNACSDLELSAGNTPTPGIYSMASAQFVLENDFLGTEATGIQVSFNKIELNVVGVPIVSQGSIDLFWTSNPIWNVGTLAPNQTATIDFALFTLAEDYSLYGEVSAQNETDFDSTPNNGNGNTVEEDDEAIYFSGGPTGLLADLTITGLTVDSPIYDDPNELFTFDFSLNNEGDAATAVSSVVGFWISEDNVLSDNDIAAGTSTVQAVIDAGETLTFGNYVNEDALNSLTTGQYFLILNADRNDVITESNEINNTAAVVFNVETTNSCNLTIADTQLTCAESTSNSPFVFAIEVAGAEGSTVDYEILGTGFSGTIITGQLVDVATLPQGLDFTIIITDPNNAGCDYALTTNTPIAPGACGNEDCSIEIEEFARFCADFGNPDAGIIITAKVSSSTGNAMFVTINGADAGTIPSGITTEIYTTATGAILDDIVFTDISDNSCTAVTSSFPISFPNECANVACTIFEPQVSNISCTETTLTFDIIVTGNNLSENLELRVGTSEVFILPDVLTTVSLPREGATTEILLIDLDFSPSQFQDFCLRTFEVDCIPDQTEGADVTLDVSNNQNTPIGIYEAGEAIFTLTNTGTSPATGLTVTFTKNQVNVTGAPTTTAGTAQLHWTDNPIWNVGTLAPGQSEFIVFPVFTVGENFSLYAEVTAMNETDSDSTPNNGNGSTPVEDDEALWPSGDDSIPGLPDLVLTNTTLTINSTEIGGTIDYSFTIENQGNAPNMSDFVYSGFVTDDSSISTPYSGQGTELVTETINPGQSITRSGTFTINANVPDGYNYFGIIVDGGGNIPESNEDNNAYLDGLFFFDEANNPCMVELELININCTEAEGVYDLTIAMEAVNLFPINQTYTYLNGEFLGVAFSQDSDVRTFFDIPFDQVTTISTTDSASDCIDGMLTIEIDPATDCDVVPQGVDLELSVVASTETVAIYNTYSITYTLINAGNADATGIIINSPRHPDVVFEGGNEFTASQGDFDYLGVTTSVWGVGSLAAGESATITMNFFTLDTGAISNYAFVVSQNEPDFDSTPNQWVCCVPVEDDEAGVFVSSLSNFTGESPSVLNSASFSINAYPVPAQDYLTIEISSETLTAVNLEILDVTGRAQIFQEIQGVKGVQTVEILVADLEKGVYLLSVRNGEEAVVQRFVKM